MKSIVLLAALAVLLLQLMPAPYDLAATASDENLSVHADPHVPAPVVKILRRACMNCHSHETQFPWYGHVAPASWLLAKDVSQARQAMNFSLWGAKKPGMRTALAMAACEDVRSGRMPKPQYLLLHPEARLSAADVEVICGWPAIARVAMGHKAPEATDAPSAGAAR